MKPFSKSFTQQEALPAAAIKQAVEVMQSGRLHRYNTLAGEASEVALLEREYAAYQGVKYCLACASGGYALHIALCSVGLVQGDKVLTNAYTLAPVPGAIHNAGGVPVFVEIDDNYHLDLDDLRRKADSSQAKFLLLSHMRGHIADMDAIVNICNNFDITLIEDCAHTMGAFWGDQRSGNFGKLACFSTQTYKHLNSGEGGLLTSNDADVMAKAILHSGSYMLYQRNGTVPDEEVFQRYRLNTPNYSGRMDNLRAAILRHQLPLLDANVARWNQRYDALAEGLAAIDKIEIPKRGFPERYVGSSIQFRIPSLATDKIPEFIQNCLDLGVELKWFGEKTPRGFTSRYDSWQYLTDISEQAQTLAVLEKTFDMRVPLTFSLEDCQYIVEIIDYLTTTR